MKDGISLFLSFPVAHAFFSHISLILFLSDTSFQGKKYLHVCTTTTTTECSTRSVAVGSGTISRATTGMEFNKMHCAKCRGCAGHVDLCSSPSTLHNVSWPDLGVENMGGIQVCRKMKSDPGRIPERGGCYSVTGRAYTWVTKCETL